MMLRRVVLLLIGKIILYATLSAGQMIKSGSTADAKLMLPGKVRQFSLLKSDVLKVSDEGLRHFANRTLPTSTAVIHRAEFEATLNARFAVQRPSAQTKDSSRGNLAVVKATIGEQNTSAARQTFPVVSLSPNRDE